MRMRCSWVRSGDALMISYHDQEYGRKKANDTALFEKLCLECFQAGLSWRTVLQKRDALREAFCNFEPSKAAQLDDAHMEALINERAIIRNRRKIEAVVHNARLHVAQFSAEGSFKNYIYGFTDGAALCRDLKIRGYRFVGETVCTSFLMSVGAIEGHEPGCSLFKGN